eukprot:g55770.t1
MSSSARLLWVFPLLISSLPTELTCEPTCRSGNWTYAKFYAFNYSHLTKQKRSNSSDPYFEPYLGSDTAGPPNPDGGGTTFRANICGNAWDQDEKCQGMLCQYKAGLFIATLANWSSPPIGIWQPIDPLDCEKGMSFHVANVQDCVDPRFGPDVKFRREVLIDYACDEDSNETELGPFRVQQPEPCLYRITWVSHFFCFATVGEIPTPPPRPSSITPTVSPSMASASVSSSVVSATPTSSSSSS